LNEIKDLLEEWAKWDAFTSLASYQCVAKTLFGILRDNPLPLVRCAPLTIQPFPYVSTSIRRESVTRLQKRYSIESPKMFPLSTES
jgi:hypothetical protein